MNKVVSIFCTAGVLLGMATLRSYGQAPDWRLLFSNSQDIVNPWGKLSFGASPLQKIGESKIPGTAIYCAERPDGAYDVYACSSRTTP